ncbi:MAG: hypothetical protein LBK99_18930 [Opitutaceae bacterium]|jgi:hypothetical protein|nr:hypothetical protein [Opitutaceae bacterium]
MKNRITKTQPARCILNRSSRVAAIIATLALGGFASVAHALSISQTAAAPDTNVIITSGSTTASETGNVQYNHSVNNDRFGGVAFSLSQPANLGAVTVLVQGYSYGAGNNTPETTAAFSVSIVTFNQDISSSSAQTIAESADAWTSPPPAPALYTTVYSETVTMPSSLELNKFLTFSFSDPVALAAGTTYGIVFHWVSGTATNSINIASASVSNPSLQNFRTVWLRNNSAHETDPNKVTQYDTSFTGLTNRESVIILQSAASNIPEPATNAVISGVVALAGIVACRFCRFRLRSS